MKKLVRITVAGVCVIAIGIFVARIRKQHAFTFTAPVASTRGVERENHASSSPSVADDWPQWRGPNRDGVSAATGLLSDWPDDGPPLLWTATGLGRGMAGVSVADGRILTMGKRDGQGVCLVALDAENGEEVWSTPLKTDGEPNGTPTIDGEHAFAITYDGVLVCAETATGHVVWQKSFVAEFGGNVPQWGYSESPLVDGNVVVCTPGAEQALIVALEKATGATVWKSRSPSEMQDGGHDGAGDASIVVGRGAGIRQYVQLVGRGVIGVSTADGTPLWGYNRIANHVANIPTPIVHEDYVFVSTGYGAGAALLRLEQTASGVKVNEVYFHPGNEVQNHHGGRHIKATLVPTRPRRADVLRPSSRVVSLNLTQH